MRDIVAMDSISQLVRNVRERSFAPFLNIPTHNATLDQYLNTTNKNIENDHKRYSWRDKSKDIYTLNLY